MPKPRAGFGQVDGKSALSSKQCGLRKLQCDRSRDLWVRKRTGLAAVFGKLARGKELLEQELGESGGIVAKDTVLFEKIVEDDAVTEFLEGVDIDGDRLGALGTVALGDFAGDVLAIGDDPVDDAA